MVHHHTIVGLNLPIPVMVFVWCINMGLNLIRQYSSYLKMLQKSLNS